MSSASLDSNLFRRLLDHGPDRPVAKALADFAALRDRSQEPAFFDPAAVTQALIPGFTQTATATARTGLPFP